MTSRLGRQQAACCLLLLLAGTWRLAGAQQIETVTDLKQRIYTEMPLGRGHSGDACVRLLWAGGVVGCAAPTGQEATEGRLLRLTQLRQPEDYPDNAVYQLPPELLADFLLQCQEEPSLAARVRGVLAEPAPAPGYSQAAAAPLSEFALYSNKYYTWNPTGKGLNSLAFPFPVFLLDNTTAQSGQERAAYNEEQHMNGALHYARMRLTMEAAASGNSSTCLAERSCLPVGGHSVVAALPPLSPPGPPGAAAAGSGTAANASTGDLPAIWILSQFDSTALFHEAAVGAESPVSGLIAMLAAAELLGSANASSAVGQYRYCHRLVFAALGGEPWGMMGSKRLLWEAAGGSNALAGLGLSSDSLAAVLEVAQVGRAQRTQQGGRTQDAQLFAHTPADGAAAAADMLAALQAAAGMLNNSSSSSGGGGGGSGPGGSVTVTAASPSLPGLPPTASSGSFVRVLGSGGSAGTAGAAGGGVPALLLTDFEAAFQGSDFQSHDDTLPGVDADSIASTAVVLAQAAHSLALGGADGAACGGGTAAGGAVQGDVPPLPVDYAAVKETVEALMQCLLNSTLGLNCPLARAMMTPVSGGKVGHYVGILRTLTADPQEADANIKSDFERFIWNWLAFATRPKPANSSGGVAGADADLQRCQPLNATACPPGFVCAGSRGIKGPEGEGFCLNATVRYVPSYSTSLLCDGCAGADTNYEFRWKLTDAAAQWEQQHGWPPDPVWAESNWPANTPSLTLFLKEDPWVENVLLGVGLAVAAASVAAVLGVRSAYHRKLKRQ